jgi:hypothetical protein
MPESKSGTPSVGWIKFLAIVTVWLTIILVALIIVSGMFVWRFACSNAMQNFSLVKKSNNLFQGTLWNVGPPETSDKGMLEVAR